MATTQSRIFYSFFQERAIKSLALKICFILTTKASHLSWAKDRHSLNGLSHSTAVANSQVCEFVSFPHNNGRCLSGKLLFATLLVLLDSISAATVSNSEGCCSALEKDRPCAAFQVYRRRVLNAAQQTIGESSGKVLSDLGSIIHFLYSRNINS